MYSIKKNVLQVIALLKAFNIRQVVLSPGSRNAPLIQSFTQDDFFICHTIVDERNAGFYALGIIQKLRQPVVVCCTSGSAVLNYAPAVSEAFYQQLPMIVLTADRTPEWVGQMDGQTLPQPNAFEPLVRCSVNLPEIKAPVDEWYCNRQINEALIACTAGELGPVHINIALSEPLFDYSQKELPEVRRIEFTPTRFQVDVSPFAEQWQKHHKRLIIVGQMFHNAKVIAALEALAYKTDCVIFSEHLSNAHSKAVISNFDAALTALGKHEEGGASLSPDLVISFGGHIVSKRLKHFLREHHPAQHWHLSLSHEVVDLYQALTHLIQTDAASFFSDLTHALPTEQGKPFQSAWRRVEAQIPEPDTIAIFSDLAVAHGFINALPKGAALHLANSSIVRNAQMFALKSGTHVYCNRGTNGIESSLPSAIGYASVTNKPVYLAIGDLSFFYTVGALWNTHEMKNLRILLMNNGGGGIFHLLPGLTQANSLRHVAATHDTSAGKWAEAAGLSYLCANDMNSFDEALKTFMSVDVGQSVLLEVFTDMETNKKAFQDYYKGLNIRLGTK